jgi:serine/threonine-protein kinase
MEATESAGPPSDASSLVGTLVDHYRVESLLGQGGMGAVFRAFDTRLERWVALKTVAAEVGPEDEVYARFAREARLLSAVDHSNVARVYAVGAHRGRPYYVMEYVEGRSLAELLDDVGRLSGQHGLDYLIQATRGLQAAAERGVVHRDVKPSNLMIGADGQLRIVDFGLARRLVDATSLTASDRVLGTPRYMSPEQTLALEVDHRSDIYSLGATFYHLFAGTPPFDAETPLGQAIQHLQAPLPPLRERNPRVPAAVAAVLERMLEKEPERRYASYAELLDDLESARAGAAPRSAPPPGAPLPGFRRAFDVLTAGAPAALGERGTAPLAPPSGGRAWSGSSPSLPATPSGWLLLAGSALVVTATVYLAVGRPAAERATQPEPPPSESVPAEPAAQEPAQPLAKRSRAPETSAARPLRWPLPPAAQRFARLAEATTTRATLQRLAMAIAAYAADRNELPPDLDALRDAFGLGARDLVDGWGSEIVYETLFDAGYRLVSAGADREEGTDDDIVLEDGRIVAGGP